MSYATIMFDDYEDLLKTTQCDFTKYRDEEYSWWEVLRRDRSYVEWCVKNVEHMDDDLREALQWALDHVR